MARRPCPSRGSRAGGPILSPHAPAGLRTQPQMFEASVRYGVTAQAEARGSAGARLFSV